MKETALDRYLTRDPHYHGNGLTEVLPDEWEVLEGYTDVHTVRAMVDELECSTCHTRIGWDSETGWTPFLTDDNESVYLCRKCGVAE